MHSMIHSMTLLYKIFFIWLLLQFFVFNIVTYSLWFDQEWMKLIRLRKEVLIVAIALATTLQIYKSETWIKQFFMRIFHTLTKPPILTIIVLLLTGIAITAYTHATIHALPRSTYILAFKYDFLGFVILIIWWYSSSTLSPQDRNHLISRYGSVIKVCLVLAIGRYALIFIKPWILKLAWYNNFIYEGTVWWPAPAAYYTHINQWLPRNQFLFERPISRGFYLTAVWPFFYMMFLHGKKLSSTRAWRAIYAINVIITFSRAARGSRVIEILALWVLTKTNRKQLISRWVKIFLPLCLVLSRVWWYRYYDIFARTYSNTWHIMMLRKWIDMSIEKPLYGHWAWTAWPASHRDPTVAWFNPENQFVQVFVEFGATGFVPRMVLFCFLCIIGLRWHKKHGQKMSLLFWLSVWMIGLGASWMVLHSFTDRMIVYPYMLLFWLVLYHSYQHIIHIWNWHDTPKCSSVNNETIK